MPAKLSRDFQHGARVAVPNQDNLHVSLPISLSYIFIIAFHLFFYKSSCTLICLPCSSQPPSLAAGHNSAALSSQNKKHPPW